MTNNAQQDKAKADAVLISQQWSGPLPPPAALAQFEQLIPHGAERILAMVEREQARRIDADKEELTASIKDTRRGHYQQRVEAK